VKLICRGLTFAALIIGSTLLSAQATGTPTFSSIQGSLDDINLGNLNVHWSFPVFARPGRKLSFSYALSLDSSVWSVISGIPTNTWAHSPSWGRIFGSLPAVGAAFYNIQGQTCHDPQGAYPFNKITFTSYLDPGNTGHPFNIAVYDDPCTTGLPSSATGTATDGSGVKMTVSSGLTASATLPNGTVVFPIVMDGSFNVAGAATSYTTTDSNGNRITLIRDAAPSFQIDHVTDTLGTTVLSSTGEPTSPVTYTYTSPAATPASVTVSYTSSTVQTNFNCANFSGFSQTGVPLLNRVTLPDTSFYQFTYEASGLGGVTARIASVRLPTGAVITYTYPPTTEDPNKGMSCIDGSTTGFDRTTPDGGTWKYRRTVNSSLGNKINSSTTKITDPDGNVTVVDFYGGYEVRRKVYQGSDSGGTLLETLVTCYNGMVDPAQCPTATVTGNSFSQVSVFLSVNGTSWSRNDTLYDTANGNVTDTYVYDFGATTALRHTHTDYDTTLGNGIVDRPSSTQVTDGSGNLESQTDYIYDEDQSTLQPSGASQFFPPSSCSGGATKCRGNLTTLKKHKNATATLNYTFTHYDTGQVYQSTDVNGAVTTSTYGACGKSYLTNLGLPLSLSKSFGWNCTGGVMTSATDENLQITHTNYASDQFFWRPDSTQDELLNTTTYTYTGLTQTESALPVNGTTSSIDIVTTLDTLGRSFLTQRRQSPTSSQYDSVERHYGTTGRPNWTSVTYAAAKGIIAPTGTPTNSPFWDALGRPATMIYGNGSGGTTNYTYPNLQDTLQEVTPAPATEHTKKKQLEYDALGRLTSVCEVTSASGSGACGQVSQQTGYWTTYTYDSPVNSMTVTQNAQAAAKQTRNYLHDFLGRLTTETNPESGSTKYFYDSAPASPGVTCPSGTGTSTGDLVKKYDAQGNTICYGYDTLHRLITIKYPGGPNAASTPEKHFVYDSATVNGVVMANAKGRLAEAYTGTSQAQSSTDIGFNYNARGEPVNYYEATPHSGGYYTVCVGIWPHGVIKSVNCIPGIPMLNYGAGGTGLDGEGRVTQVTAQTGQNPVTGVTYTMSGTTQPIGSITQVTYGSADSDNFSYSPNTGALNSYVFHVGSQTVTGNLTWNTNGSFQQLQISDQLNAANSQTCTYLYDDLGRIGLPPGSTGNSVDCGASKWQQIFSYDAFGNIKKTVPTGGTGVSFTPTYATGTSRYTSLPGFTPTYDANGDLTADGAHSFAWDAEGHPVTVDTVGLTYDALGRMVEQARGSSFTQIVYGPTGKLALMNGQTLVKGFATLPGGGTAVYTPSVLPAYYRHADWLGTSRLATTPSRTMYYDAAYAPFGEPYVETGTTDRSFTGQNQDTVSGLHDFMFREYDQSHGRWMSPDPAGISSARAENPQTWNRYAYVTNHPGTSLDPLGTDMDCILCLELNAENRNVDFSAEHIADLQARATLGEKYYSLPGHSNPVAEEKMKYLRNTYGSLGRTVWRNNEWQVEISGGQTSYSTTDKFGFSNTGWLASYPAFWITINQWISNWQLYPSEYRKGVAYIIANRAGLSPEDVRIQEFAAQIDWNVNHIWNPCEAMDLELVVGTALIPAGTTAEHVLEKVGTGWGLAYALGAECK
jgi:RHS repeat-associated protein